MWGNKTLHSDIGEILTNARCANVCPAVGQVGERGELLDQLPPDQVDFVKQGFRDESSGGWWGKGEEEHWPVKSGGWS